MAFKGITFAGQNVTPKNDGGLYQAHYGDGILWGCSMAISGDDLVIQSGEFIAGGRVCFVDGATNVDLSGRLNATGYIQVIMNYDLSQGEGSQWYTSFVESATTTFPALTQGAINDTATLYQIQLAVVQVSGGNLTSVYSSLSPSNVVYTSPSGYLSQLGGTDAYRSIQNFDNGTNFGGIAFDNTGSFPQTEIYANDGRIMFRPKGQSVSSVQVYLGNDGLFHGGVGVDSAYTAGSLSLTANTWTRVQSLNVHQGTFIACGGCLIYGDGASSSARASVGIGASSGGEGASHQQIQLNTNSAYRLEIGTSAVFQTATDTEISLWINPQVAKSVTDRYLKLVQVG